MEYEIYEKSRNYIEERIGSRVPDTGIILGSGLNQLASMLEDPVAISYADIPGFFTSTAPGHEGRLICGRLAGRLTAVLQGRFHYYEGRSFEEAGLPVRVLSMLGVKTLVITNAAGCVRPDWKPGELMLISDYIKFFESSPLRGRNIDAFGVRFPDMTEAYSKRLRKLADDTAQTEGITLREGVYFFMPGPQYETPAEIRAIRILGGDAVGMSTVPETIAAAHCGMEVLGISLLSNMAAGITGQRLSAEEVLEAGKAANRTISILIKGVMERIDRK